MSEFWIKLCVEWGRMVYKCQTHVQCYVYEKKDAAAMIYVN